MKRILVIFALAGLTACDVDPSCAKKVKDVETIYDAVNGWWRSYATAEDGSKCYIGIGVTAVRPGDRMICAWKEQEKTK